MGLFSERSDEEQNVWAGLPSEPRDTNDVADVLAPAVDPLTLGLGAQVTSIVFPVAPPAPDAVVIENREPDDEGDAQ